MIFHSLRFIFGQSGSKERVRFNAKNGWKFRRGKPKMCIKKEIKNENNKGWENVE
jgi:hypothetical protein